MKLTRGNTELNLMMLVITFLLFNGMVNLLLYDDFFIIKFKWKYDKHYVKSSEPLYEIDKDDKNYVNNSLEDDNVSVDSFKILLEEYDIKLILDTIDPAMCKKGNDYVIDKLTTFAIWQQLEYKIPASFTLCQIILETGWGTSPMFKHSNQMFGRKCFHNGKAHWKEHSKEVDRLLKKGIRMHVAQHCNFYPDDRPHNRFINYDNYLQCGLDRYSTLMWSNGGTKKKPIYRYRPCFKGAPDDYKHWAKYIKLGGWATSETYTKNLISIVESNQLYNIDRNAERIRKKYLDKGQLYFDKSLVLWRMKVEGIVNLHKLKK